MLEFEGKLTQRRGSRELVLVALPVLRGLELGVGAASRRRTLLALSQFLSNRFAKITKVILHDVVFDISSCVIMT